MRFPRSISSIRRAACPAATAAVIALAAFGCGGGSATSARMYTLKIPEPPPAAAPASKLTIGVETFSAVTPLNDSRILKYESPTELKYYEDDRWVSEPTTMIPEFAARYLERMGIARQAGLLPWVESMDYILQGQILNFEEVASGESHEARVALELTLRRFPNREVVWSGTFRARQTVAAATVPAAVEALSIATQDALKEGFGQLAENLQRQP